MTTQSNYKLEFDVEKMCRVCLLQKGELSNVYSSCIVDGNFLALPDLIRTCLDIQLEESNVDYPRKICDGCKMQVINFYAFKEKSKRADEALTKALQTITSKITGKSNDRFVSDRNQTTTHTKRLEITDELISENKVMKISSGLTPHVVETTNEIECDLLESNEEHFDLELEQPAELSEVTPYNKTQLGTLHQLKKDPAELSEFTPYGKIQLDTVHQPRKELTNDDDGNSNRKEEDDIIEINEELIVEDDEMYLILDVTESEFENTQNEGESGKGRIERSMENVLNTKYLCTICQKNQKSAKQMENHMQMHDVMRIMSDFCRFFECSHCRTIFLGEDELRDHCNEIHAKDLMFVDEDGTDYQFLAEENVASSGGDGGVDGGPINCGICEKVFKKDTDIKQHLITHLKKFECPYDGCGSTYGAFSRLTIHMVQRHFGNRKCVHCDQDNFDNYYKLTEHMKNECTAKKFECNHCDKKFFSDKALKQHLISLEAKKFICRFCSKAFAMAGELKIHIRMHTNERPFQCTICEKSYKTASMRASHMDSHIDGKTFTCDICNKKLQTRVCYRNHMKRHSEIKKHKCESCHKAFHTKYHVKLHTSRVHNNERPQHLSTFQTLE